MGKDKKTGKKTTVKIKDLGPKDSTRVKGGKGHAGWLEISS